MKLYHYVHCPFCIRVRMAAGLLGREYKSIVLPYDDEKTPIELLGRKMLPIVELEGELLHESLDIIKKMDQENQLKNELATSEIEELLNRLGPDVHSLAMPYWMWTPEFDTQSRAYFQKKKELKRGPFTKLVQNRQKFIDALEETLSEIVPQLGVFFRSSHISILDILLASHLWGMYVVPEFQFSPAMHNYLQRVKDASHFNYHEDYWP